jgi:hypothetical protein
VVVVVEKETITEANGDSGIKQGGGEVSGEGGDGRGGGEGTREMEAEGGEEEVSVKVEEQADEQAETEEVVVEEEEAIAEAMVTAVSPRANRLCDDPSLAWAHAAASSLYPPPRAHSGAAPRGGRAARPLRAAASACNRRTIEPPRAAQPCLEHPMQRDARCNG